jgi:hypothetical protein
VGLADEVVGASTILIQITLLRQSLQGLDEGKSLRIASPAAKLPFGMAR